jgi:hypothetical protein
MAVRSKMSTARSRGRAVVKTTTEDKNALPKEKPKTYSNQYRASTKEGVDYSIADVTPEDEARIRKQYGISDKEDFVITKADYDVYKNTGKKSLDEYGMDRAKGNNPFQKNYEGEVGGMQLQMYEKGKAPKAKPDPQNIIEAAKKVPKLDKFAVFTDDKKKSYDVTTKEKKANEDVMVPAEVKGPKNRVVSRKTITVTPKRSGAKMYKKQTAGKGYSPGKLFQTATVEKTKGPRLSEKIKYKKEEKLAGARERVLGMSGVETEDRTIAYNKSRNKNKDLTEKQAKKKATGVTSVKRGEKTPGSAQRLRDIKALYDTDSLKYKDANGVERSTGAISAEKVEASTAAGKFGSEKRVSLLKEAKSNIKDIGNLSRTQIKATRKEGSAKGRAITKAKEMKAEYKAAKRPAKFSKGTSKEDLAKDVAAMKSTKTAAEMKTMKTSARSAMKEARGMTKTKEERSATRSSVKNNRELAREARSYKGDVRKGLRMEKKDALAMKVADKASDAKKARKAEKGKTMRGTSYFSMTELNKTTPLSGTSSSKKQAGTKRYSK